MWLSKKAYNDLLNQLKEVNERDANKTEELVKINQRFEDLNERFNNVVKSQCDVIEANVELQIEIKKLTGAMLAVLEQPHRGYDDDITGVIMLEDKFEIN